MVSHLHKEVEKTERETNKKGQLFLYMTEILTV